MSTTTGCRRTGRMLWLAVAMAAGIVSVAACHRDVKVSRSGTRPPAFTPPPFPAAFLATCASMGWTRTCDGGTFTDDQKFILNANDYGPHAYVAPSTDLGSWTRSADFSTPRLVALAYVDQQPAAPGGLPAAYTALLLSAGANCVYLHYAGTSFTAYVEPATTPCSTSYAPNPARALPVEPVTNPSWDSGSEQQQADNVPPVARFHEARGAGNSRYALMGVRCGNRWCLIQPKTAVTEENDAHQGDHQDRRGWSIKGWSDQQHLAIANATGGLMPSSLKAAIYPEDDLKTKTFPMPPAGSRPGDAQHAATIVVRGKPLDAYDDKWHLRSGNNSLFLWKDSSGAWHGEIQNKKWLGLVTNHIPVQVERLHAGSNPPATARLLWSATDEDLWVACDGGCCYVTAFN